MAVASKKKGGDTSRRQPSGYTQRIREAVSRIVDSLTRFLLAAV